MKINQINHNNKNNQTNNNNNNKNNQTNYNNNKIALTINAYFVLKILNVYNPINCPPQNINI